VSPELGVTILSATRGSENWLSVVIEWIEYLRDINVRSEDDIFGKADKQEQKNWRKQMPLRPFYSPQWRCSFIQIKVVVNEFPDLRLSPRKGWPRGGVVSASAQLDSSEC